jgi:hypothetical protein
VLVSISPKPNDPKAVGLVLTPLAWAPNRFVVGGPRRTVLYREGWGPRLFYEVDCAAITHPETLPPEGALEHREAPPTPLPLLCLVSAAASPSPEAALSSPKAVLHLTACRRRPCIDDEPRHGQGSDHRRWSASIPSLL